MAEARINAEPGLQLVATAMMGIIARTFESQGRRGGGSWRQDTPDWSTRKAREGLDPRIGHATLALRRSLTVRDDPAQILHVTNEMVNLSTVLPYAGAEQKNRPFIKFTYNDRRELRLIIRRYLLAAFHSGGV